ncbi:hypothetical protein EBR66_04005 [bacterium]|nr:hypothetical protein [bacterium]
MAMQLETFIYGAIALGFGYVVLLVLLQHAFPKLGEKLPGSKLLKRKRIPALELARIKANPLLTPTPGSFWESEAVFNPAAIFAGGRVHLLYRAMGGDGISRIGYASSKDGIHFDERVSYPVFGVLSSHIPKGPRQFAPELYESGGGWGGAEDPRAVIIDDRVFLSFQAFAGWHSIRIGVVSMPLNQFLQKRFLWANHAFLSAPNKVNKNWVIFPEKINGKYAVFHGIKSGDRSTALVDYVDSLTEDPKDYIQSDARFRNEKHDDAWDTIIRGAGPPPLRTKYGWLVLYHATDKDDSNRYKLGALLLDLENPRKILNRAMTPLLEPNAWYENEWKVGVIYACGAVIKDGTLFVYYGGGDKTINVAHVKLDTFLEALVQNHSSEFTNEKAQVIQ